MTHHYKTSEGGATVTIFVPYDCRNHCPFCVNKQEYAHAEGFSVEAILKSIAVMDEITPRCDFVFTGGEPFANLKALQRMLAAINFLRHLQRIICKHYNRLSFNLQSNTNKLLRRLPARLSA